MGKRKLTKPTRRNMVVLAMICRGGSGAGAHKNKRREMQVPRKRKHKGLHRPPKQLRGTRCVRICPLHGR